MCAYERRTFLLCEGIIKVMKIDFSYVINLSRDFYSVCEKFWKIPENPKIPFFVLNAVNGQKLSEYKEEVPFIWKIYQGWNLHDNQSWWNRNVTPGELGCSLSHYWSWKGAYEDKVGNTLFLEEDFSIQNWPTKDEWDAVPEDWDMIYLGRALVPGHEDTVVNEHVVKVGYSYNMHAYVLSPNGLRKVLNTPFLENIVPVDEFMPAVIGVHPRKDITDLFHLEEFNAYAFSRKNFVWQESNSLTSQTERVFDVRDVRDWDDWLARYLNPDFINRDYKSIAKSANTQGGVLEFPLFTERFCAHMMELINYASDKIRVREGSQVRIPINNIAMEHSYNRIIREYLFPFLDWYWQTRVRNVFACKSYVYRYGEGKTELDVVSEHESIYCMALRLTDVDMGLPGENFVTPLECGNVVIHPTILTENYEGKKFVYDNSHCILSFF